MAEENAPAETENVRKKALTRLSVAAAVTVFALAGLWWLDQSGDEPAKAKPASPAPIIAAPAPILEPASPAGGEEPANTQEASTEAAPQEPPPPPQPGIPVRPAKSSLEAGPTTSTMPAAATSAPNQTVSKPILANAEPPAGRGYVVQLGVFTNPGNAQELVERLRRQGIRAYTETRVHVGPFLNRAEADKAQAELRRLGISGVVGATR